MYTLLEGIELILLEARNLKYYPLSVVQAIKPGGALSFVANSFKVPLCAEPRRMKLLKDFSTWELLNIRLKDILDIPSRLQHDFGVSPAFLDKALAGHIVQTVSKQDLDHAFGVRLQPQLFVAQTRHMSWPKAGGK